MTTPDPVRANPTRVAMSFAAVAALLGSTFALVIGALGAQAHVDPPITGAPSDVTISAVEYAADGTANGPAIDTFRYAVYEDIAHQTDDGMSAVLNNPHSYSRVVATGDQSTATVTLDPGKYLVSVVGGAQPPAPGTYKSSGKHFTVTGTDMTVAVALVKEPLPTASIAVEVFHDNQSVNGARDLPVEQGLEGFAVLLEDGTGEVSVDIYGNPICTQYDGDPAGEFPAGNIVGDASGQCLTDADGKVIIHNLGPHKYGIFVNPPNGSGWVQSTTIEGTQIIDTWVQEGNNGFLAEQGNLTAQALFGFVQECQFGLCPQLNNQGDPVPPNAPTPPQGAAQITGRIREIDESPTGALGPVVDRPYLALNNLSGNDEQVYTGRGNTDGTFSIPQVPPGTYQLVIWDAPLDNIIQFRTVIVGTGDATVDMGDIGVPRWFGTIEGYVYWDTGVDASGNVITGIPTAAQNPDGLHPGAENGFRDCQPDAAGPHDIAKCEDGIANQDLDIRFKDGSIKYATFSDSNGWYSFPEVFPFPSFMVWEVGFGRQKQVGTMSYLTESGPDGAPNTPVGYPYDPENMPGCPRDLDGAREPMCDPADSFGPASLLQAALTFSGSTHWIDTGKVPYAAGENGGISGIVHYGVTRNEYDPRHAAAEDYEPGVPNVAVNLYRAALDGSAQPITCTAVGDGCPYGAGELKRVFDGVVDTQGEDLFGSVIDSVETDGWTHPTDCRYDDFQGGVIQDPLCLENQRNVNQLKDGVFDGGYAFEGVGSGAYIVEMVAPDGYRHIKEEDQNTDQGDEYVPPPVPAVPPPPCAGPEHLVNDARNPADGTMTPLCESKFVRVTNGTNPPAEFYVMTDFDDSVGNPNFTGTTAVPPPGLIRGFMSDDLNVDFDPASPNYQGKRGVANTSIGILDFQDHEIARVDTDAYGYFEVLLPSGTTISCPTPGGICASMYKVVGNYPGQDPLAPIDTWNPNYTTLTLPTDVWSGKTTFSDIAIIPVTSFAGFANQPVCTRPGPDVQSVSAVSAPAGGPVEFTIDGSAFGSTPGTVSIGGFFVGTTTWTENSITVTDITGVPAGPGQLVVTDAGGAAGQTGITFHVIGGDYQPSVLDVGPGQPYATIQAAVDAASDGQLIVVHPGTYYESPIVYKNVKLQGFGPGVTSIDARFFGFGPAPASDPDIWIAKVDGLGVEGPTEVPIGQVVTVVATNKQQHNSAFRTQIDGFDIIGGDPFKTENGLPRLSQGGGVYAHAFARRLQVSNNLIQSNSGNAGGGVVLGQAYVGDNNNDDVRIHHNRILNNGGLILAGGIGVFDGADNYEIDHNQICGNYSAEYGGGISHFGVSEGGWIHDNDISFNSAFDEGGGVMIASELPLDPADVPAGSGEVTIERNLIRVNASNDDGGGVRLLAPVDGPVHIVNNMIVDNLATDVGGGIALDDALDVDIINNTIARNVSTGTAEDADRSPGCGGGLATCAHAAGIASTGFSAALGDSNPAPPTDFTDPVMFNNILWQNEAFHLDPGGDLVPDPAGGRPGPVIDLEVIGTPAPETMTPEYSVLTAGYGDGTHNIIGDPLFVDGSPFVDFQALPLVADPTFVSVQILTTPADPAGDWHLQETSPARNQGAASFSGADAPFGDIDGDARNDGQVDVGADEIPTPINEAPLAEIVSPAYGEVVTGPVTIRIAASDAETPVADLAVTWNVDGGAGMAAPYNMSTGYYEAQWDTTPLQSGSYTINATVDDGTYVTGATTVVTVDNGAAPTVAIVDPADGDVVSGTVAILVEASDAEDASGALTVTVDVDGQTLTTTWNGTYYEATWPTGAPDVGAHTITASAVDSDLQVSAPTSVTVTVTTGEPVVTIVAPTGGSLLAGTVPIRIDATDLEDQAGGLTVEWRIDGGPPRAATYNAATGLYESTWDTTAASNGAHTVGVTATDSDTNTGSASVGVTVDNAASAHIGDLNGFSTSTNNQKRWNANVTITAHDQSHAPVAGATITVETTRISKSDGSPILATKNCTTSASGTCTIVQAVNENSNENTVTFRVTGLGHASLPYLSTANHDNAPPASDGTTITVTRAGA